MPTIPCRDGINCQPCNDFPIANFSAESPDDPLFCQTVTFKADIPLGICIDQIAYTEICCSGDSDLEAYLCALREAQENVYNTWRNNCAPPLCPPFCAVGCPPPPCAPSFTAPNCEPNCPQPPDNFINLYYNDAQTCSVLCPDGSPFTVIVPHGTIIRLSQHEANSVAYALACKLAREYKLCISVEGSTNGCKNQFMSFTLRANGILTQFPRSSSWTITGPGIQGNVLTYDDNMVIGSVTMVISGTPTIAVETYITARINDINTGYIMERVIPISIGEVGTSELTDGAVGTAYGFQLVTNGLTAPLSYAVISGSLPAGLTLNSSTGIISGTPTTAGTYNFTIGITDSSP